MHEYRFGLHACLSLLIPLFLLSPARATNYYVNCATGSNGNDGLSPTTAWQTIAYAAGRVGSLDIVTVNGGPCTISSITFGPSLSGSGDCRAQDANCTIFRGDNPSAATVLYPATTGTDGFLVTAAVHDLKFENFNFQVNGTTAFGEPFKISSGPNRIVVKNVNVLGPHTNAGIKVVSDGVATSGIRLDTVKVLQNVKGGFVFDVLNNGTIDDVRCESCFAVNNKPLSGGVATCSKDATGLDEVDGFAINHDEGGAGLPIRVTNVTFVGGESSNNGEDGYDVVDDHSHPNQGGQRIEMLHPYVTANCGAGIRTWRSLHTENGYVVNNGTSTSTAGVGIRAVKLPSDTTIAQLNIINSTFADNDGVQIDLIGRKSGNIRIYNTIASSDTYRALTYDISEGGSSNWDYNHFYRAGASSVQVVKAVTASQTYDCTHGQIRTNCDGSHPNCIGTQSDPLFGSDGKHLTSSSPGWDTGGQPSVVSGIGIIEADWRDLSGTSRPQPAGGGYDMGAFEGDEGGGC